MSTKKAVLLGLFQTCISNAIQWPPTIKTTSGTVVGFINETTPHVAQYLGIPFAEHPVGDLRWAPPVPLNSGNGTVNATAFGKNCPQFVSNLRTVYSEDATEFGTPQNLGEDCLSLSIWAPTSAAQTNGSLPVLAWFYGGGFYEGGASVPYQNPTRWVERSQKHIVVSINFRGNIFGYPNAAGLKDVEQNLGLLDQRTAIEWIRLNIGNFGGDPNRITLWGQSSGGMAIDYYNFAYLEDPIVKGLIMDSGTAQIQGFLVDGANHSNFSFVAQHFGCGNRPADVELECMRTVSHGRISAYLKAQTDAGSSLAFVPTIDYRTTFANYTERALAGNFTKLPAIVGTNADEGTSFTLPYDKDKGPDIATANMTTLSVFLCPAVKTTRDRYLADPSVATYRFLYGGNFSNVSPRWWQGAYHSSELPLVFGTSDLRGPNSPFEDEVSKQMQDYWLAFMEDPLNGLPKLGWKAYEPNGDAVLIGWRNVTSQPISEARLDAPCDGLTPKLGAVPPP